MASIGQIYKGMEGWNPTTSNDFNTIISSIGPGRGQNRLLKIGIQAPIGTIIKLNDKSIRIGRSGIYELDEDGIFITKIEIGNTVNQILIDYIIEEVP